MPKVDRSKRPRTPPAVSASAAQKKPSRIAAWLITLAVFALAVAALYLFFEPVKLGPRWRPLHFTIACVASAIAGSVVANRITNQGVHALSSLGSWGWLLIAASSALYVYYLTVEGPRQLATTVMKEAAEESIRENAAELYYRANGIWRLADSVRVNSTTAEEFRASIPPDFLESLLDLSFCQSFEPQSSTLDAKFSESTRAYCGFFPIANEMYVTVCRKWHQQMDPVIAKFPELEAQAVVVCSLELFEKLDFWSFGSVQHVADKMGFTREDILSNDPKALEWARKNGYELPNWSSFTPGIKAILARKFGPQAAALCRNEDVRLPAPWQGE
jgi:hypothetical protein